MKALVGILTAAVVVIAAVLVYSTFIKEDPADRQQERQEQRQQAEDRFREEPFYFCTFGVSSLQDPAYTECVDERVRRMLADWEEQGRPDPSTIEIPVG